MYTAGLVVDSKAGAISNLSKQNTIRMSPVNMRVLKVLIQNAEQTVSRQQLFDSVWPNQLVSEDALTRCISDLRSQLKPLTSTSPLIDTIPKVGYRWLYPMSLSNESSSVTKSKPKYDKPSLKIKLVLWTLIISFVFSWSLLAIIQWWSKPLTVPLIILPTHITTSAQSEIKIESNTVGNLLKEATETHKDLQYLSQIALQSHQGSPFPYFSHQFGVRWFIESQLSKQQQGTVLTLNLVDAKTALVIYSEQTEVKTVDDIKSMSQQFINFIAEL
jgi:DNA-binding winged helix-turn-helix (wHTH) protein